MSIRPASAHPDDLGLRASAPAPRRRWRWLCLALSVQVALVAFAVAPQLQARFTGQEYRLRVAPVDPVEPFRGAYVALGYPDLPGGPPPMADGSAPRAQQTVYVPLHDSADVWRGGPATTTPPGSGPYLRCRDRGWRLACGIESWFVPQHRAAAIEEAVRAGHAVAVVRVDASGNAALVDLLTEGDREPAAALDGQRR